MMDANRPWAVQPDRPRALGVARRSSASASPARGRGSRQRGLGFARLLQRAVVKIALAARFDISRSRPALVARAPPVYVRMRCPAHESLCRGGMVQERSRIAILTYLPGAPL